MIHAPPRRDPNVISARYWGRYLTFRKVPCPRCPKCSHVEAVIISTPDEADQTLYGDAAVALWDVVQTQEGLNK